MNNNPLYLIAYGCALMGIGQYSEAVVRFDGAHRLAPSLENALIYKGLALYLNGQVDEAMDIEPFKNAFVGQIKEELLKQYQKSSDQS